MAKDKKQESEEKKEGCTQCEEYKNGWRRALADYENLQKDLGAQREDTRRQIKTSFVHELLPVMDNFAQAITHTPKELPKECETWMQGVTFIEKQFVDVLTGLGVEKIEIGDEFDPHLHESVGESEEMKEVRAGWKIGDHVIRPAQVLIKNENKIK